MRTAHRRAIDIALVSVVPLVTSLVALLTKSFWGDEIMSLDFASRQGWDFVRTLAQDYHPPLYFILLKLWMGGMGDAEWSLRLFQSLQGMLLLAGCLVLYRRLFPPARIPVFFIVLCAAPELWLFLPMLRYYTLAAALAVWATVAHLQWTEQPTRARDVVRVLMAVAILLTDYPTSILILLHFLHTLRVRRDAVHRHLVSIFAAGLAFLPWLAVLAMQITTLLDAGRSADLGGMKSILLKFAWSLYAFLAGETSLPVDAGTAITLLVAGVLALRAVWTRSIARASGSGLALLIVFGGIAWTAVLTTFISRHTSFIYTPARTFHALPFVFVVLGLWTRNLPRNWMRHAVPVILIAAAVPSIANWAGNRSFMMPVYASPWREIVHDTRGAYVLSDEADCYAWYARRTSGSSILVNAWSPARLDSLLDTHAATMFIVTTERESTPPQYPAILHDHITARMRLVAHRTHLPYSETWRMVKRRMLGREPGTAKFHVFRYEPR